jgi:hypothetical protein
MILLILWVKPKKDKESNNNNKVTISAIKMVWDHKQKNIARASTWPVNLTTNKDCNANKDNRMDCDDDCYGGLDYNNKRV